MQQAKPIRTDHASATAGSCGFGSAQWQHNPSSLPMTPSGCAQQPGPISAPQPRSPSLQGNRLLGWRAHPQGHLQGGRPRRGHRSSTEEALGTAKLPAGLAEDALDTTSASTVAARAPRRSRAHQPKAMPLKRLTAIVQLNTAAHARRHGHTQPAKNIGMLPAGIMAAAHNLGSKLTVPQGKALQAADQCLGSRWAYGRRPQC